jgi:hypothetical protein
MATHSKYRLMSAAHSYQQLSTAQSTMVSPRRTLDHYTVILVEEGVNDEGALYTFARNGRPVQVLVDIQNPDICGELAEIEDTSLRTKEFYKKQNWSAQIMQMLVSSPTIC